MSVLVGEGKTQRRMSLDRRVLTARALAAQSIALLVPTAGRSRSFISTFVGVVRVTTLSCVGGGNEGAEDGEKREKRECNERPHFEA